MSKRILNLGCGSQEYGTDRVDIHKTPTTTLVHDVETGIPFPDNAFDEVYERNLLEHLRNVGFHFQEIHRVLKPQGKLTLITDNSGCLKYYFGTHTGLYEYFHNGDHHFSLFTIQHLLNHLAFVGFELQRIGYVDTDHPSQIIDQLLRMIGLGKISYPRINLEARKK